MASAPVGRFMRSLLSCPKILIAAVNGPAVGIGTTILLHVDLVFASPTAWFWLPFLRAGIVPEFASSVLLPQLLGSANASRMLLLGDKLTCEEAAQFGLVGEIKSGTGDELVNYAVRRFQDAAEGVPYGISVCEAFRTPLIGLICRHLFSTNSCRSPSRFSRECLRRNDS